MHGLSSQIGTGFKDEELTQHTEFFKNHILEKPKPYYRYNDNGVIPDHWFDSVRVSYTNSEITNCLSL